MAHMLKSFIMGRNSLLIWTRENFLCSEPKVKIRIWTSQNPGKNIILYGLGLSYFK